MFDGVVLEMLPSRVHMGMVWFFHVRFGDDPDFGRQMLQAIRDDPAAFYDWLRLQNKELPPPAADNSDLWETVRNCLDASMPPIIRLSTTPVCAIGAASVGDYRTLLGFNLCAIPHL
jgi:hypothetical protein